MQKVNIQNDLCYNGRKKTGRKFGTISLQKEKNYGVFSFPILRGSWGHNLGGHPWWPCWMVPRGKILISFRHFSDPCLSELNHICILLSSSGHSDAGGSEKHLTGNLGERLRVLDPLLLLLLHLRHTISPTIAVYERSAGQCQPDDSFRTSGRAVGSLRPESPRRAAVVTAALVVGFWVGVLLPGKTGETGKLFTGGLEVSGWRLSHLVPLVWGMWEWGATLWSSRTERGVTRRFWKLQIFTVWILTLPLISAVISEPHFIAYI